MKRLKYFLIIILSCISTSTIAQTDDLQNLLNNEIEQYKTPGVVLLISSPQKETVSVAAGYSNLKNKTPMTINNNFRIASMSKTFLAVVVLKLSEEGKFNLDDNIADYLPDSIEVDRIPNGDS